MLHVANPIEFPMPPHPIMASLLAAALSCGAAHAAESVSFPGAGAALKAFLYRPTGSGPFPAVVALHGCAGLYEKSGALSPRHVDWAERLAARGFIVLLPDSFGSRGAEAQCRTDDRVTSPSKERVEDVLAARNYLQSRPDVKADAISLLGWSNGGSTVLYAVQKHHRPRTGSPISPKRSLSIRDAALLRSTGRGTHAYRC
jgi:dienelactone hydrolase